jgi:arsenate reductase
MAELKVYLYANCGTCRKATKWLDERALPYKALAIRETPPSIAELQRALESTGNIRKILNTSSQDYRDLGLKEKLDNMPEEEVFALLQQNGNLVKRPFVVAGDKAWAGFNADSWEASLA